MIGFPFLSSHIIREIGGLSHWGVDHNRPTRSAPIFLYWSGSRCLALSKSPHEAPASFVTTTQIHSTGMYLRLIASSYGSNGKAL